MRKLLTLIFAMLFSLSMFAERPVARKILFFGDSMTGWMAERLQAYGEKNGFEVAAVIWDGATIKKYGNSSAALARHIKGADPDAVFVSLGMNEMAAPDPAKQLGGSLSKLKSTIGDIPVIWIGPCSWPGKPAWGPGLDRWLSSQLGAGHYFSSLSLKLPRQSKTNPHPTRAGIDSWIDDVVEWLATPGAAVALPGYAKPSKEFARPKSYVYRKMKAAL